MREWEKDKERQKEKSSSSQGIKREQSHRTLGERQFQSGGQGKSLMSNDTDRLRRMHIRAGFES